MDRAPLPPHERSWRHPSELGPPAPEPTSTSGRVLIVTTATLSLVLIGLLALSMTPDRGASPVAVESTAAERETGPVALGQPRLPMVAPLGDDGWAVTTAGAVGSRGRTMAARLPSGTIIEVAVVRRDTESGITLVSLPDDADGYRLASSVPGPTDTVVVHGEEREIVTMADVAGMDVAEGTPVLDSAGDLIGICTTDADGVAVMPVSTMPPAPTPSTTAPRPTSTSTAATTTSPATTAPAITSPPVTVPPTTAPPADVPVTGSTAPAAPDQVDGGPTTAVG